MKKLMKAMVLEKFNESLVLKNVPIPEPTFGQVRIKVKANGICATDLKIRDGRFPSAKLPLILGHEVAGIVDKLGEGYVKYKIGDRVVLRCRDVCGECEYCKKGFDFLCEELKGILGNTIDGGYAEYVVIPEKMLEYIPDGLSFAKAAVTTDSVATAYYALAERINIQPNDTVLIMGVGGLGMNGVQIAKALGAIVIAADIIDEKLELAKKMGADYIFNTKKVDLVEECKKITKGKGVDFSAEFVGHTFTTELAIKCLAVGGTQIQPGYSVSDIFSLSHFDFVSRSLTLIGSRGLTKNTLTGAMKMVCDGLVDPQIDANSVIKLEAVNEIHEKLRNGEVMGRAVILYE